MNERGHFEVQQMWKKYDMVQKNSFVYYMRCKITVEVKYTCNNRGTEQMGGEQYWGC